MSLDDPDDSQGGGVTKKVLLADKSSRSPDKGCP